MIAMENHGVMTSHPTREENKAAAQVVLDAAFRATRPDDSKVYDVFFWIDGGEEKYLSIPWADRTKRSIELTRLTNGTWVNEAPLPNGMAAGTATFAGCVYRGFPG